MSAREDHGAAKRDAWWQAASFVRGVLGHGFDFEEAYGARASLVEDAMFEVIAEMERRGKLPAVKAS